MTIFNRTSRRIVILIALLLGHILFAYFSAGSAISEMPVLFAALFWGIEIGAIFAALFWFQSRIEWPIDEVPRFALKTIQASVVASLFLSIPLTYVDFVFGVNDLAMFSGENWYGIGVIIGLELVEETIFLIPSCVVAMTVVNWLSPVGYFLQVEVRPVSRPSSIEPLSEAPDDIPPFWVKLRQCRHGKLLALEAQQHYIMVHTSQGCELIHYRFGSAVKELEARDGALVHRSYWVARSGIKDIVCKGRKTTALLSSGAQIPISRSRKHDALDQLETDSSLQSTSI